MTNQARSSSPGADSSHRGSLPYERTEDRTGHANGFKPKTMRTRVGEITFAVPQVREGGFYPPALEKGLRSERALIALAEMYVQGVSTRKVKAITEELCGVDVSASSQSCSRPIGRRPCRNGGSDRWARSLISTWMPATRRSAKMAKCVMWLFYWPGRHSSRRKGDFRGFRVSQRA